MAVDLQQGLFSEQPGNHFQPVDDLPRPTPGNKQVLVRSLYLALSTASRGQNNASEEATDGTQTPAEVRRSAFCGVVVETGEECARLKVDDYVFGLCRPERSAYSPFQETFLVDEDLVFKKPDNITAEDAASIGIGLMTAAFGIAVGGKLVVPNAEAKVKERDSWIVILGGNSSVGQYAIQIARLCGYQVATSCSPSEASAVLARDATIAFNNRASKKDQVAEAKSITDGCFSLVFDASGVTEEVGVEGPRPAVEKRAFFNAASKAIGMKSPTDGFRVPVGQLGRADDLPSDTAAEMVKMIPALESQIAKGAITPANYQVFDGFGWDKLNDALDIGSLIKRETSIIVQVQE